MSPKIVTLLVAAGAIFSIVKILFSGLALLAGDEGDALLRKQLREFREQLDRSSLSEALWWLASTGLAKLGQRVHDPFAAAIVMLAACVFVNATAIVLATCLLLKNDPDYVNSADFFLLARDILFEFFHAGSRVTNSAVVAGAAITWLATLVVWSVLRHIPRERFVYHLLGRLAVSIVVAGAAGCVPFLVLHWALVSQVRGGSFSEFEFHLGHVLATSPDAAKVFGFAIIASAVAALPAVLVAIGAAVALYMYTSPRFLVDTTIRIVQAISKGKSHILNQLGSVAGALAALAGALVTLLSA